MSGDNDPARDHGEEQESWKDLFNSVFDMAEEVTSKISPAEIEEKLRRTLRKGPGDAKPDAAVSPTTGPGSGAERGPVTEILETAGKPGGTLCLSLRGRSLTVTLDRTVERSVTGPRDRARWRKPARFPASWPYRRVPPPPETSFWGALDPAGQQMFARLAGERTYPPRAVLMREGETADHIVVIRDGWTRVSVHDEAAERVVAHRGPGDLIGEGAALQGNVRSATVVAVGTVHALVMRTQDFAAFIGAYPEVSALIEQLIKERLTEEPGGREVEVSPLGRHDRSAAPAGPGADGAAEGKPTVVATNLLGFGRLLRGARDRQVMHAAMVEMTRSALTGLTSLTGKTEECLFEDREDGMLVLIPPSVPAPAIVERLTGTLSAALRGHNRLYNVCAQIQMRIAVDTGPVDTGSVGRLDQALTDLVLGQAGQLLEAPALVEAINSSRANLGMIVSDSIYDTAIRPYGGPVGYEPVRIQGRGRSEQAWMQMIDPAPDRLVANL
ncbi:MAG TPA: cyclic nucleotide-binding domain-containing protein [Streptosporangiaceae bacterium]|nr:cyclic nucleotide-binding domain-containing protein [Streptosporangiaceae bacterium]